jgi:hypothetical protein
MADRFKLHLGQNRPAVLEQMRRDTKFMCDNGFVGTLDGWMGHLLLGLRSLTLLRKIHDAVKPWSGVAHC